MTFPSVNYVPTTGKHPEDYDFTPRKLCPIPSESFIQQWFAIAKGFKGVVFKGFKNVIKNNNSVLFSFENLKNQNSKEKNNPNNISVQPRLQQLSILAVDAPYTVL